jgi:hypothetical protein
MLSRLCQASLLLSVTYNPFMLSVIMLNVIMLNVFILYTLNFILKFRSAAFNNADIFLLLYKQTSLMRRSIVHSFPLHLVFPAKYHNFFATQPKLSLSGLPSRTFSAQSGYAKIELF